MKMSFADFEKVSSDEKSTTLKHPSGHTIKIAHAALSKKMRDELGKAKSGKALKPEKGEPQKFADGGDVEDDESTPAAPELPPATEPQAESSSPSPGLSQDPEVPTTASPQQAPTVVINTGQPAQPPQQTVVPVPVPQPQAPVVAPPNPTLDLSQQYNDYKAGSGEPMPGSGVPTPAQPQRMTPQLAPPVGVHNPDGGVIAGLRQQQAAIDVGAAANKIEMVKAQKALDDLAVEQKATQSNMLAEEDRLAQHISDAKVDPNRYLGNMSTGGKIANVIAVILGGIGGGMTHSENQALKYINSEIDRDIDAQKANLGKKENLLKFNLQKFGNMKDAQNGVRSTILANYELGLKKAELSTNEAVQKARIQTEIGMVQQQRAAAMAPIAQKMALSNALERGQVTPEQYIQYGMTGHEQDEHFKEITEARNYVRLRDNALSAFKQVAEGSKVKNRFLSPLESRDKRQALNQSLEALAKETTGRFNTESAKTLAAQYFPDSLGRDSEASLAVKYNGLRKALDQKANFSRLKATFGENYLNSKILAGRDAITEGAPKVK